MKWNIFFLFMLFLMCVTVYVGTRQYFAEPEVYIYEPMRYKRCLPIFRAQLKDVKKLLLFYKSKHGEFPSNDEGLRSKKLYNLILSDPAATRPGQPIDCITADLKNYDFYPSSAQNMPITLSNSGLLSLWYIPFIYENRNGVDASLFEDSPVNSDPENDDFSIKVDDGVYVWSITAHHQYQTVRNIDRERKLVLIITGVVLTFLCLIALGGYIYKYKKVKDRKPKNIAATVLKTAAGIGIIIGTAYQTAATHGGAMCYMFMRHLNRRNPEMVKKCSEVLDKYRKRGVIKQETYDKLKAAMKKELEDPNQY